MEGGADLFDGDLEAALGECVNVASDIVADDTLSFLDDEVFSQNDELAFLSDEGSDLVMASDSASEMLLPIGSESSDHDSSPLSMPSDDEMGADVDTTRIHVKGYINPTQPMLEQAQVLLVNVVCFLMQVPRAMLRSISLQARDEKVRGTASPPKFAAYLMGLSTNAVRTVYRKVRENGWVPCPPRAFRNPGRGDKLVLAEDTAHPRRGEAKKQGAGWNGEEHLDQYSEALRASARLAIGNAAEGFSALAFERQAARCALTWSVPLAFVGRSCCYLGRHFARLGWWPSLWEVPGRFQGCSRRFRRGSGDVLGGSVVAMNGRGKKF